MGWDEQKVQRIPLGRGVVAAMSLRNLSEPAAYSMRRTGPDSAYAARNIVDFTEIVGFDDNCLIMPRRWPHGGRVMIVDQDSVVQDPIIGLNPYLPIADKPGFEHSCDGLVTMSRSLCLGAQGADCPVLYLYDPCKGAVGIVHCGWKSVAQHIVGTAIQQFCSLGSLPTDMLAYVAPGAGDDVYEFALDERSLPLLQQQGRVQDFQAMLQTSAGNQGMTALRLNGLVVRDLVKAGVPLANITNDQRSCIQDPTLHSYRRDGGPDMAGSRHGLGIGVIFLE